jgi:hypothetical protein
MMTGCDSFRRLSRRQFVRAGGLGFFGLTMPGLFRARAAAPARQAKASRMIVIWLGGGPPHQDMFDMKPDAPAEVRGEFKPIRTNVPGIEICELMPELAKVADKYTILRSCGIGNETWEHSGGAYWLTGNPRRPSTPKYPMYGSVVAKLRPAREALPSFVALGTLRNHSGDLDVNYLGPTYDPLTFNPTQPDDQVRTMLASPQLDLSALDRSQDLLRSVNQQLRRQEALDPVISGLDEFRQKAFDLLRSPKVREALDLSKEPKAKYERYNVKGFNGGGGSSTGLTILAARRLIEAGVPFVYVPIGYWDLHGNNFKTCRSALPSLSKAVAALLEDLSERGLLDSTIVTVLGEMGRTPKINKSAGRDHWGTAQSVLVAGGGFKGGTVVGATDRKAAYVVDKKYKVESFGRTIYHLLGIDPDQELYTTSNRPMKLILEEAPLLKEALA